MLSGVDEELLAWVPTERARYTGLGGVVLGTAVIGGFSMWFALSEVLGHASVWTLVPVLVWMLFVLNLDRWLVASSTGTRWQRRLTMLLPRLLVAVALGVVIAEPIVLRIFQTAIEKHVEDGRDELVDDLKTRLVACNPEPDAKGTIASAASRADCQGYVLSFGETPTRLAARLAAARIDVQRLRATVDADSGEAGRLQDLARRECAGTKGPGLTGVPGEGAECLRLRREADGFLATHPVAGNQAMIVELESTITDLEEKLSDGKGAYLAARDTQIAKRVTELVANQEAIGLLERIRALNQLVGRDAFLIVALWVIRIFFILIDCLPVLVKLFSGTSAYDRLVDRKIASAERVYAESTKTAERSVTVELEGNRHELESQLRRRIEEIDIADQRHKAQMNADADEAIRTLADKLVRQARRKSGINGHSMDPNLTTVTEN